MDQEHQHETPGVEPKRKATGTCRSLILAHLNPVHPLLLSWERPPAPQNVKWAEAKSSDLKGTWTVTRIKTDCLQVTGTES